MMGLKKRAAGARPTVAEVVDKLLTIGSADQIAAFFEAEGVIGTPRASMDCPVAHYVQGQTGLTIHATPSKVMALTSSSVPVPLHGGPLAEFMTRFDHGFYPTLDIYREG